MYLARPSYMRHPFKNTPLEIWPVNKPYVIDFEAMLFQPLFRISWTDVHSWDVQNVPLVKVPRDVYEFHLRNFVSIQHEYDITRTLCDVVIPMFCKITIEWVFTHRDRVKLF